MAVLTLLLGFGQGLWPATAWAQGGQQEQIRAYVERTGELVDWAHGIVSETESVPARRVLREAERLHETSRRRMDGGQYAGAYNVSRRSRAAVWHAVKLAREALTYEERVRIRGERFRDNHDQLMERARDTGSEPALDLLRRAERHAIRAREQYSQGDARQAFKLLEQAETLTGRAARILADAGGPERLDRELERTRVLIDRVREQLNEDADPVARKLLAEAEQALDRALDHRDQRQPGRALQMAGMARRLAGRAAAVAGTGPTSETVIRQLERWDERAGRVADQVRESGSERAREVYDRAANHRQRAGESMNRNELETALRQVKAAFDLLNQAEDLAR